LIANAVVTFGRSSIKNWRDAVLAGGAATFLFFRGSPILAIVASAAVSVALYRGASLLMRSTGASQSTGQRAVRQVVLSVLLGGAAFAVLFLADRRLFDLATVMVRVDLVAFGGGFASVPVMLHQVVEVHNWLDSKTFMDGIALGQVTPGPIVITATFVGYLVAGLLGAAVGTLAIFSPSFLMVLITVPYLDRLQHSIRFRRVLRGILASFVGLLLSVTLQFGMAASWTARSFLIAMAAFVALWLKVDILWVVLAGAVLSAFVL